MQEQATTTVEWHNECQNDLNESVWELSESAISVVRPTTHGFGV
ncbi:MAG TPA: hypothetical protein VFC51_07690 [Chloroflexota bacterium]|nr:hypothetical protein [Chloroflexota bacterium]